MRPRERARAAACAGAAAWLSVTALSASAAAQAPPKPVTLPTRGAQVGVDRGVVDLTVAFRDIFDAATQRKLRSGLPTVVTTRAYLFGEGGGDAVALSARSCRIVYDLWDEVFRIELSQAGGTSNRIAVNLEGVLRICAEARRMPLAPRALLKDRARYFVAVLAEINPLSAEMLEKIKRWVARPNGATAIGPADSLFGSFVGLFVARIGDADRKLAFRTQLFYPPDPPKPKPATPAAPR